MNVAIFTGEISGDLIGAALARALVEAAPDIQIWGLGSNAMRAAGVDLLADSASYGAIGVVESLAVAPRILLGAFRQVKATLRQRRPDVVVLIDFGFVNVRIARYAHQLGLKTCYYFPPGSWKPDGFANPELARITNVIAAPYRWSVEIYQAIGARAEFVGHPLIERVKPVMGRKEFADQFGLDLSRPIVGMLPGSRRHEIVHLMPVLLDAARAIYRQEPGAQFVIAVAPSVSQEMMAGYLSAQTELRDRLNEIWHEFAEEAGTKVWKPVAQTARKLRQSGGPTLVTSNGVLVPADTFKRELDEQRRRAETRDRLSRRLPPTVIAKGLTYDVMAYSDVLLACSGTATLEAAVLGTPMVILYRGSKLMEMEYRLRGLHRKLRFIGHPNILAQRSIVPELIQEAAEPEAIARHAIEMMNDLQTRGRIKTDLQEIRNMLGSPGASERTAHLILELAGFKK
jgi:lipid-A-disaccharide synthase